MIKITRIYSDGNGESHFEDIEMPLKIDRKKWIELEVNIRK